CARGVCVRGVCVRGLPPVPAGIVRCTEYRVHSTQYSPSSADDKEPPMPFRYRTCLLVLLAWTATAAAVETIIRVDASKATGRVRRSLAGPCSEAVNHEIYGGLYSQMVFGESFQEPPAQSPVKGFRALDGRWSVEDGELRAGAGEGPKLVSDHAAFADGEAGV